MKFLFLISLFISSSKALAQGLKTRVPVEVQHTIQGNAIEFSFKYKADMQNFSVIHVRGLNGLSVEGELNSVPKDVKADESDKMIYSFTKDSGLAYMILDLEGIVDGEERLEAISVKVGNPTQKEMEAGMDQEEIDVTPLTDPPEFVDDTYFGYYYL